MKTVAVLFVVVCGIVANSVAHPRHLTSGVLADYLRRHPDQIPHETRFHPSPFLAYKGQDQKEIFFPTVGRQQQKQGVSFECEACDLVVKELVWYLNVSGDLGETLFHQQADAICEREFDEWLAGYCEYVIDGNILQLYDVIVQRKNPQIACQAIGACTSPLSLDGWVPRSGITRIRNPTGRTAWSFIVISDTHIGQASETSYVTWLMQEAVNKINSLIDKENIRFVIVTGDVTDSAMPPQWVKVKSLLDQLKVPYFPVLGNHDVWSYNNTGGSYEEPYPTGDAQFARTFADRFASPNLPGATLVYNNQSCHNPHHNITSWFQNWMLTYQDYVFIGLDWNSRTHALRELGYKGAWPGASAQDFPGGTLPWLRTALQSIPRNSSSTVILFQHHPFAMPWFVPEAIYSFPSGDKAQIRRVIETDGKGLKIWGLIAGHLHTWFDGQGFTPSPQMPDFRQWLTEATKVGSAITLINIDADTHQMHPFIKLFGIDY